MPFWDCTWRRSIETMLITSIIKSKGLTRLFNLMLLAFMRKFLLASTQFQEYMERTYSCWYMIDPEKTSEGIAYQYYAYTPTSGMNLRTGKLASWIDHVQTPKSKSRERTWVAWVIIRHIYMIAWTRTYNHDLNHIFHLANIYNSDALFIIWSTINQFVLQCTCMAGKS